MYGLIKTHIKNNAVRVVTSKCGTAIDNFCQEIFIQKKVIK